ncbi:NAD-dependent epimerase [Spirulina major CS-329]|jgi:UDP-glucuronate 4-epimerase|uniref:NAD-dependent epimerase n=1 Tax=Spirulina TaxID=1154 RepID=UPI0023304D52|nr:MULTISPECIES: NAD-dependent epimerase [Spirulina]MDB9495914.1 NAD-dependent epimerase [Spirulina subsalsa CS-330]MDB9503077.1 NAD-dependent epimerase [Spirulina major CS-329]
MTKILVTGAAGFIGFHLCQRLLQDGTVTVVGLDNLNAYYDVGLKRARLEQLEGDRNFEFVRADLSDRTAIETLFQTHAFQTVVHLAAQAGVRYSLENPHAYVESNLVGFLHILEGCRQQPVEHLVFASSSSVYGNSPKIPFSIDDNVDYPVSLYAATKKSNELMAHCYSHLYQIPMTGLRFFTVYGPWGRPDMAYWKFTEAILRDRPIEVYNHGKMQRDFTYVDDVIEGIIRVMAKIPDPNGPNHARYKLYNIGNHSPIELMTLIETLETCLGREAVKTMLPMQPGDVPRTYADVDDLIQDVGFRPSTPIQVGLQRFVDWYQSHHALP